jgi:hypothetical protein
LLANALVAGVPKNGEAKFVTVMPNYKTLNASLLKPYLKALLIYGNRRTLLAMFLKHVAWIYCGFL